MKARSTTKPLKKKKWLQLWQAVAVLNYAALKERVDKQYAEHLSEVGKSGGKPMSRLRCLQLNSLEFYAESDEATQEDMKKRIQEDTIDALDYLLEAQDTLGEEEMKQYLTNYRHQLWVIYIWYKLCSDESKWISNRAQDGMKRPLNAQLEELTEATGMVVMVLVGGPEPRQDSEILMM